MGMICMLLPNESNPSQLGRRHSKVHAARLGAALTKIVTPDRHGKKADVVLYPANPRDNANYMGVVVGRCANRISNARFTMPDGREVQLTANDGPHALHAWLFDFLFGCTFRVTVCYILMPLAACFCQQVNIARLVSYSLPSQKSQT
ncbi:galactose mutarotase-like domain-containing protein [Dunaliella salina]|uniref:Galactose mutarotase-like domain-containing protein n=1 Tax=Dunaliella salina TaxID=3046 RepID=A0ABQ7H5K0_DUNSA|nr:galactose mutarotase-like domain-containing protein [Dunaliella salina]|eukprot:KAF5842129.1 galactose mutarotase-like domain-containing protein [Dunaliella salina]